MSVTIRLAVESDAPAIQAIYAPYVAETPISFELAPPSIETMGGRIQKIQATHAWVVCQNENDELIGYAYASQYRERLAYQWSVEVTAYADPRFQRGGVGRGLYTSLFALLRLQGYFSAFAGITLPNDSSVGLHQAMGFQAVGIYRNVGYKFGKWYDVSWWGLALQPSQSDPPAPKPLAEIMAGSDFQKALLAGAPLIRF